MSDVAWELVSFVVILFSLATLIGLGAFIVNFIGDRNDRLHHERRIELARIDVKYHPNSDKLKQELEEIETTYIVNYGKPYKGVKRDE